MTELFLKSIENDLELFKGAPRTLIIFFKLKKERPILQRLLIYYPQIVCIDEATANVDQETDKFIQAMIKSSFQSATVITIAHRIKTIMHCDRYFIF